MTTHTNTTSDLIARSRAARHRASRTVARARFTDDLRTAHANGHHQSPEGAVDPSGYWAGVGCPSCAAACETL